MNENKFRDPTGFQSSQRGETGDLGQVGAMASKVPYITKAEIKFLH